MYTYISASRYQHEDSKRTIMRLEQCAQSLVHRAIALRGAFAMLYGRNLKQYIKKREVHLLSLLFSNMDVESSLILSFLMYHSVAVFLKVSEYVEILSGNVCVVPCVCVCVCVGPRMHILLPIYLCGFPCQTVATV